MKSLKVAFASLLLGTGVLFSVPANAAQPVVAGRWAVDFYTNPNKTVTGSICITFRRVAGAIDSMPLSGTWSIPGFSGGGWVQYGDLVQIFMSYEADNQPAALSLTGQLAGASNMGGIAYVDATKSGTQVNTGTWVGRKVASCPTSPALREKGSGQLLTDQGAASNDE
jgi:hypothetical protein